MSNERKKTNRKIFHKYFIFEIFQLPRFSLLKRMKRKSGLHSDGRLSNKKQRDDTGEPNSQHGYLLTHTTEYFLYDLFELLDSSAIYVALTCAALYRKYKQYLLKLVHKRELYCDDCANKRDLCRDHSRFIFAHDQLADAIINRRDNLLTFIADNYLSDLPAWSVVARSETKRRKTFYDQEFYILKIALVFGEFYSTKCLIKRTKCGKKGCFRVHFRC
jgi:hypothetical protein